MVNSDKIAYPPTAEPNLSCQPSSDHSEQEWEIPPSEKQSSNECAQCWGDCCGNCFGCCLGQNMCRRHDTEMCGNLITVLCCGSVIQAGTS